MSPLLALNLFVELQRQRLHAAHISAAPRQTFTANLPRPSEVFRRTPAHRREYSPRTAPRKRKDHGTVTSYVHDGCRCYQCAWANSRYHTARRQHAADIARRAAMRLLARSSEE